MTVGSLSTTDWSSPAVLSKESPVGDFERSHAWFIRLKMSILSFGSARPVRELDAVATKDPT